MKEGINQPDPTNPRYLDVDREMAILFGVNPQTYDLLVKSITYGNHMFLDPIHWGLIESYFVTDSTMRDLPKPKGFRDPRKVRRVLLGGLSELYSMLPEEDQMALDMQAAIKLKDPNSALTRSKLSISHTNPSQEVRQRYSRGHRGLHHTEETKAKIKEARLAYFERRRAGSTT